MSSRGGRRASCSTTQEQSDLWGYFQKQRKISFYVKLIQDSVIAI